jgi:hypothetical protein
MNAAPKLASVPDDAATLLDLLAPGEPITFQIFGEGNAKGARGLNRVMHGTLAQHRQTLAALNARGAGVFWMPNAGNCKGRKASNVRRVRALFVDLDGAPLEPVQAAPLHPHAIVESSPGRWHAYWRIADCPLADFAPLQKALAKRFDADTTVHDLPRVLRLPGFLHRKCEPFASHILSLRDAPPYMLATFRAAFGFDHVTATPPPRTLRQPACATPQRQRRTLDRIPEGERNARLLSLAAGFVRRGFDLRQTNNRLQQINTKRCQPPLDATEVDAIALRAIAYGSEGFAMLPHKLLDSPEWRALAPAAQCIVVAALRRFDGSNNGNIALPWTDFKDSDGYRNEGVFYRHRIAAVQSGILIESRKATHTQQGITPTLYAISERFLRVSLPAQSAVSATCTFWQPYIDKQSCAVGGVAVAGDLNSGLQENGDFKKRNAA